jgi:hypothetical protein
MCTACNPLDSATAPNYQFAIEPSGVALMKSLIVAGALAALIPTIASAQNMSCADYLKAEKQMSDATGGAKPDADAAALDKKVHDYCVKNPTTGVDKAMEEATK